MMNFLPPAKSPELVADIDFWTNKLAVLRGDNIYDVSRLYFASRGINTHQERLESSIPHGLSPADNDKRILSIIEDQILTPAGLKFVRTIMGRLIVDDKQILGSLVNPTGSVTQANYDLLGTDLLVKYIKKQFDEIVPFARTPFMTRLTAAQDGSLTTSLEVIPSLPPISDVSLFYPYMEKTPAQLWAEFAASRSNVLLLIGPPGTGKSNFILEMMHARGFDDNIHMADRHDVIINRNLSDYIRSLASGSVMITEDSDELVRARNAGNENMSSLLNATAGIVSRDVKIIISTNLESIQKVDTALTRPGRCFAILEYQEMSRDDAVAVRKMMELDEMEIAEEYLTLAEALNYHERPQAVRKTQQGFGFSRS